MSVPVVSLIVVTYRSARLASALLDSVGAGADEVIVVDSASPDDDEGLAHLADRHPDVTVVRLDCNRGYGAAANAGLAKATGDVVVVSNADVTISEEALRSLCDEVGRQGVVLAAPRFVSQDGELQRSAHRRDVFVLATIDSFCGPVAHVARRISHDWHPTYFASVSHSSLLECAHVLGALMAIDADALRAVGGFDESFFMYREETDLCRRLRARGGRIVHAGAVEAVHLGGGSTSDPWPHQGNLRNLESHYHYIDKHHGRAVGLAVRVLGAVCAATWLLAGPALSRPVAKRALRWHVGLPVGRP
ncbi:MAG: N-acetylglucosaminyl-diphospho-decaprenol L-rhamnosyltransferase [Acidimicrobiaceae bacterium]|jgi:GT2 family glycosyltransferase